jgi:hypothetical protein
MDTKEIQERIQAIDSALIDKGFKSPDCDLTVSGSNLTFWVKTGGCEADGRVFEPVYADSINEIFAAANEYVKNLEDRGLYAQREAVKKFGRAIDGLRNTGIPADFIDPLSEQLQAMTENLLTDQRVTS